MRLLSGCLLTLLMVWLGLFASAASADGGCYEVEVPRPDGRPPMVFTVCP